MNRRAFTARMATAALAGMLGVRLSWGVPEVVAVSAQVGGVLPGASWSGGSWTVEVFRAQSGPPLSMADMRALHRADIIDYATEHQP